MTQLTTERVEELIEQQRDELESSKYQSEHWQRGPRDLVSALTRLLALEAALREAGPALDSGADWLLNEAAQERVRCGRYKVDSEYFRKYDSRARNAAHEADQLRALAALGGEK